MKKVYIFNMILGLTLGCLFVHCKHKKDEKRYETPQYNSIIQDCHKVETVVEMPRFYDYKLTVTDAAELLRQSNIQRGWRDEPPLKMTPSQIKALNGEYEWQSTIAFNTQREMFDYICEHFNEMQKYKVGSHSVTQKTIKSTPHTNIYDEYQDRLHDYLDDPEDEITFNPDIFDFQDD